MAQINFPINRLKQIEPLLIEYYYFDRPMLHNSFETIHDIYIQNGYFSKESEEIYLSVPSFKQDYMETTSNANKMYERVMNVGKAIVIDLGEYDHDVIRQMYFDYVDEETLTDNDWNISYALVIITAIYYKYVKTDGFFDLWEFIFNSTQATYSTVVRPDLLKLYELFHLKKKIKSDTIRIEYNNEVITLDNFDNWFTNMITPYLDKYLGVSSLEEAQTELDTDYPNKRKKGRKRTNQAADMMLMGTCNLLQHSSFAESNVTINKSQAEFLLRFLKYLGLIEEDSSKDDILNLRATLSNLKKNPPTFDWWSIPMQKQSPNNPFDEKLTNAW